MKGEPAFLRHNLTFHMTGKPPPQDPGPSPGRAKESRRAKPQTPQGLHSQGVLHLITLPVILFKQDKMWLVRKETLKGVSLVSRLDYLQCGVRNRSESHVSGLACFSVAS